MECHSSLTLFYFALFLATIATAGMTLSALLIASFVSSITKKFGKKEAGSFALIGAGFIYVLAFVLSIQNPLVFAILLIVAGIVMGYYTISMYAYVTDVIDDFYIKRGTRRDGTIYSVYSFTRKVGQAIAGLLADVLLT
ncbi:MFS transporter [Aerococcus urinaeequi]|nr:MFS transporter [Aerococcus urinaeequi]